MKLPGNNHSTKTLTISSHHMMMSLLKPWHENQQATCISFDHMYVQHLYIVIRRHIVRGALGTLVQSSTVVSQ